MQQYVKQQVRETQQSVGSRNIQEGGISSYTTRTVTKLSGHSLIWEHRLSSNTKLNNNPGNNHSNGSNDRKKRRPQQS